MADKTQDITETGAVGLQGLKGLNAQQAAKPSKPLSVKAPVEASNFHMPLQPYQTEGYGQFTETMDFGEGKQAYGNRRVDPNFINPYQLENLEDTRAQLQSNFAKVFNGTVKGITTAGTTFLNGTLGLLVGLGTGVYNMFDNDENTSFGNGIWNNVFNDLMNKANEKMEEIMPNYYTNDERNNPLRHLFNANFIGDKFIKNFGFTVGALGSAVAFGGAYGAIGKLAARAAMGLGTAARTAVGISKAVTMGAGAVAAAAAEGSIEALQTANQMKQDNEALYAEQRDQNIVSIQANPDLTDDEKALLIEDENRKYGEAMLKLNEDRVKAGNMDFLLNIPILTASNIIQFGKLLGNGYRSALRTANVARRAGKYTAGGLLEGSRLQRGVKAFGKSFLSEGSEEVEQQIASDTASNLYSLKLNDYYKAAIDNDANAETANYIKETGKQILNTLGRADTIEQFLIGGLTGVLGMPVLGRKATARKADIGKGKAIGISGGFFGQLNEIEEEHERNQAVADYMNQRLADPKFKEQYQGLVRHLFFQDRMDRALDANLEKEYKDNEVAQLYNDVMMFMSAGKKDLLVDMIKDSMHGITDEQAAQIIQDTTKEFVDKDGNKSLAGPFIKSDGNRMSADEVRERITKNGNDVLDAVTKIENAFDELDYRTGGKLSNDQLQQLAFMQMQTLNWLDRTKSVGADVKTFFDSVKQSLKSKLDAYKQELEKNPSNTNAQANIKSIEGSMKTVDQYISTINSISAVERAGMMNHSEARSVYNSTLTTLKSKYMESLATKEQIDDIVGKIQDLVSMSRSMELFEKKKETYMKDPNLLTKDNAEILEQMQKIDEEEKARGVAQGLSEAKNIAELDSLIGDINDDALTNEALNQLVKQKNPLAIQYTTNRETAKQQVELVDKLGSGNASVPTLKNGRTKVTAEDAEDIKKIIEFRRVNTNPIDGAHDVSRMSDPYLTVMDEVDPEDEDGRNFWYTLLGLDENTKDGAQRIEHLKDVFAHVAKVTNEEKLKNGVLDNRGLYGYPEKEAEKHTSSTGADGVATVPPTPPVVTTPVTPQAGPAAPTTAPAATHEPVKNEKEDGIITKEDLDKQAKEETDGLKQRGLERDSDSEIPVKDGKRAYWKNNIPEYGAKEAKEGKLSPPLVTKDTPYALHATLTRLGAYKYADENKIKAGDRVRFVINPKLSETERARLAGQPTAQAQLEQAIYIVKDADNQVIGVLPASAAIVDRYSGLSEFIDWAQREYDAALMRGDDVANEGLDLGVVSEVKEVMNGFLLFGEERVLKPEDLKNVKFVAEYKVTGSGFRHRVLHISPANTGSRPMVKIGRLNKDTLNSNTFRNSRLYKGFQNKVEDAVRKIKTTREQSGYSAITDDEAKTIWEILQEYIYLDSEATGAVHINANDNGIAIRVGEETKFVNVFNTRQQGGGFSISGTSTATTTEITGFRSATDVFNEIVDILSKHDLPIQIDFNRIDETDYMLQRAEAGVLSSNVEDVNPKDVWFTIEPIKQDGKGNWASAAYQGTTTPKTAEAAAPAVAEGAKNAEEESDPVVPNPKPDGQKPAPPKPGKTRRRFRLMDRRQRNIMNKQLEKEWLDRVLPQLSAEDRVRFTRGLIRVTELGKNAWGMLDKGIVTISDVAAEGTTYHEAFHVVFNMLLSQEEKQKLYNEARRMWKGVDDELELEEKMAEEFRRFVQREQDSIQQPKNLGERIAAFFRGLWQKVKNWNSPVMYSYFAKINEGEYANEALQNTNATRYSLYNPLDPKEQEAYERILEITNGKSGDLAYYKANGRVIEVPIYRRGSNVEFRFNTLQEAQAFQDFWRKEAYASFSEPKFIENIGKYRVYMHKPQLMTSEDIEEWKRITAEQEPTAFDRLEDTEREELNARGYSKEDFNSLTEEEQQALKDCFFTM